MNQFQPFSFADVEEFLDFLTEEERKIVRVLRSIIQDCLPEAREKLAYNVPFYYRNRRLAYIWPASVPWGGFRQEGVALGFCYGHLLDNSENYLLGDANKQIRYLIFRELSDIDPDLVRAYLLEAMEVDSRFSKAGKKSKK